MVLEERRRTKLLGWLSLSMLVLGAAAFIVPVALFTIASGDQGVALQGEPAKIDAPANRTWGIYIDDADNSGYSESCTATDSEGRPVAISDPGATMSSSDTEMLDHVFKTPPDVVFTINCSVSGAEARVGPVGNFSHVVIGVLSAAFLGLGGLVMGIVWLTRRTHPSPAVAAR